MPDSVTHYCFGREVMEKLPREIRERISLPVFDRAVQGPDPWSTIGFYGGKMKQYACRSGIAHKEKTGEYLRVLTEETRKAPCAELFSLLAGSVCHYCLDRRAHPYIICKGGDYDGTAETYRFRGGHVRLERAIDSLMIRRHFGKKPWRFSIPRQTMALKQYPEKLRESVDRIFYSVYGWENGFDLMNRALRDERRFYGLMQDPFGLIHYLLRLVSGGKTNYCMYSYYRRDADGEEIDYLNEKHHPWHHPAQPNIVSTESFFGLYNQALLEAQNMILGAYNAVYKAGETDLQSLYGESSYSTGLDWNDPGNQNKMHYEPLMFSGKYFNHEKGTRSGLGGENEKGTI